MEGANLKQLLVGADRLPDNTHREWRKAVIGTAKIQGLDFTHGVAAKLINIYLKAGFHLWQATIPTPRVQALHPPIDGLLLEELYHRDVGGLRHEWSKAKAIRWSNFTQISMESNLSIRKALGPNVRYGK